MPEVIDGKYVSWSDIFNTNHSHFGLINKAQHAAVSYGYPFFMWNDVLYISATGQRTDYEPLTKI